METKVFCPEESLFRKCPFFALRQQAKSINRSFRFRGIRKTGVKNQMRIAKKSRFCLSGRRVKRLSQSNLDF
jgi:hypothetical protein